MRLRAFLGSTVLLFSIVACGGSASSPPAEQEAGTPPPASTSENLPSPNEPPVNGPADAAPNDAGGDAAPPSDGGDAGPTDYCAFRTTTCGRTQADCAEEKKCFSSLRAGAGAAIEACVLGRAKCNQVDDCLEEEALKHASQPAAKSFATACLTRVGSCGTAIGLSDDDCANFAVFPDATLAELTACVEGACASIDACVSALLTAAGCD